MQIPYAPEQGNCSAEQRKFLPFPLQSRERHDALAQPISLDLDRRGRLSSMPGKPNANTAAPPTPEQLNRRSGEFWKSESAKMEQRIAQEPLREEAFRKLKDDAERGVPTRAQLSLERALEQANAFKTRLELDRSRRGGRARKPDALQLEILAIVKRHRSITCPELEDRLRERACAGGPIVSFNAEEIIFSAPGGRRSTAAISGLKDRLSRAKRALNSR